MLPAQQGSPGARHEGDKGDPGRCLETADDSSGVRPPHGRSPGPSENRSAESVQASYPDARVQASPRTSILRGG